MNEILKKIWEQTHIPEHHRKWVMLCVVDINKKTGNLCKIHLGLGSWPYSKGDPFVEVYFDFLEHHLNVCWGVAPKIWYTFNKNNERLQGQDNVSSDDIVRKLKAIMEEYGVSI